MNRIIFGHVMPSELIISNSELSARLSRAVTVGDAGVKPVLDEIYSVMNIRFAAVRLSLRSSSDGEISFEGFSVKSSALSAYFDGCEETYLFVATLGSETDRLIKKRLARSTAEGYIYDAVASAIAEAMCDAVEEKIHPAEKTKSRFSPGYADCPLSVQREILNILCADKYAGVKLLDSQLMMPMKSVSAFVAVLPKKELK